MKSRPRWLRYWAVLGFFTCLYLYSTNMTFGTLFESSDGQVMYETSRSLALEHDLTIEGDTRQLPQVIEGHDGNYYSKYDLGLPLLAVPSVRWADDLGEKHLAHRYFLAAIIVKLIPSLSMGLALTALYAFAETLYDAYRALWIILSAGLGTTIWVYGTQFFAEAVIAATLTIAVMSLYYAIHHPQARGWVDLASFFLGYMLITRASTIIYLPVLGGWVWYYRPAHRRAFLLRLSLFPLLGIGVLMWHNVARFGSVWVTGYEGETFSEFPLIGMIGLLVSSGKSVFLYAPPLILSGLLFPRFRQKHPALAILILMFSGVALMFYGSWWAWHGGWVWGPRFLVPLMPLWCLPLGMLPKAYPWRVLAGILVALGFGIQILGVFTNVTPHYAEAFADSADPNDESRYAMVHYDIMQSPLVGAWHRAQRKEWDSLAIFRLSETGLPSRWSNGIVLGIGIIFGLSLSIIVQEITTHEQAKI